VVTGKLLSSGEERGVVWYIVTDVTEKMSII
jgi:hypothetical protein